MTDELLRKHLIISNQVTHERLHVVLSEFEKVLQNDTPGAIVELGCYIGTTSLFLRRMLDAYGQSDKRELHVYDSFAGLPEKSNEDSSPAGEQFKAGELTISKKLLLHEFRKASLKPPTVHKAWFGDLTSEDIPAPIAFAFLDGDFYSSILDSLELIWPKLSQNATVAIDDYDREALPGVERAVRDFLHAKPTATNVRVEHDIAIMCAC